MITYQFIPMSSEVFASLRWNTVADQLQVEGEYDVIYLDTNDKPQILNKCQISTKEKPNEEGTLDASKVFCNTHKTSEWCKLDRVVEIRKTRYEDIKAPSQNRNELCACGSGIKFKKCCGK